LAQIAQTDSTLLVRVEAVRLLGELDAEPARQALQMASQDPQSEVRMAVVHACSTHQDPAATQLLQQMIGSDSDIDIRLAATRALKSHRGPQAVEALALALDDPNPALQLRATESLSTVTGQKFGNDIPAWREYVRKSTSSDLATEPAQIAEQPDSLNSITR
jgi:HEAT repeat protein